MCRAQLSGKLVQSIERRVPRLYRTGCRHCARRQDRRALRLSQSEIGIAGTVLIYVVGDERDLVRVRTNFREETVYLYRLNASPDDARRLFMVYLKRINELADRPEFYHLLSNSCTINIIRYANAAGRRGRFDIRHLLNGLIDSYLYHSGRVDTTLPFDELRRRSQINEAAQAANDAPDFSERIRASLPTITR
jgi:hypothetical protein